MNRLYVLVGIPGSGKSTWAAAQDWSLRCTYISTDQYVETYARSVDKTYSEVFEEFMPKAVDLMTKDVITARNLGKDIIWDQTSTTVSSRKRKLVMLPDYYSVAVVFPTPDEQELWRRLSCRPGKVIPQSVITQMIQGFEYPTIEEGFKEIWIAE